MDHSRIHSLNTSSTSQSGNNRAGNTGVGNRGVGRGADSAGYSTPAIQKSGQFGVVRAATNLRLGDIIRGEISDLSGDEITITLENNTMIRGQISDSSMLSIGQKAAFRLDSLTPQGVLMEPVSGYTENELTIINKALEEANLPITEHNQAAVKALMDNMMPINRDAIQQLMQLAYDYKTNDMSTLALMNRLFMPINADSIQQFSNYRQGTEQLANQLQDFSRNLPALMRALAENGSADTVARFGEQLLQITQGTAADLPTALTISALSPEERAALAELLSATPLDEETFQALEQGTLSLRDAMTLLRDSAANGTLSLPEGVNKEAFAQELALLAQTLEPAAELSTADMSNSFHNIFTLQEEALLENAAENIEEEIVDENVGKAVSEDNASATQANEGRGISRFLQSIQDTVNQSLDTIGKLRGGQSTAGGSGQENTANVLRSLSDLSQTEMSNRDLTASILSPEARQELADILSKLPISSSLIRQMLSGEATTQEVLQVIKNAIPLSDSDVLKELFRSESFEQLFAKGLQSGWSISPDKLMKEGEPDRFLGQLAKQMNSLEQLIGSSLSGSDSDQFRQGAHDIQSNIQFMKELSETFTYLQLPLKLPNQTANSELYVYTQKEKRRMNPEKMSVLLHLDLENLGQLEIKLDKDHQEILANFKLEDEPSVDLLRANANLLQSNLAELGYQTNIQVTKQEGEPVSMDDFLNTRIKTHATEEMKRFSFDIRA
ncbi:MAG: flagellar hook-length control protein FliK [Lachnospiraceae bacterium]|nr:flagellar hook-length control protein FliK [Lachnospiraceae bacterium]